MRLRSTAVVIGLAIGSMSGAAQASSYTFSFTQTSAGVLETGSGTVDLSGLIQYNTISIDPFVQSGYDASLDSPPQNAVGASGMQDLYIASFLPYVTFGTNPNIVNADSGTGSLVGFQLGSNGTLAVPQGYSSGDLGVSTATYNNQTFASLGLTPGTYVYSYTPGSDESTEALGSDLVELDTSVNTITVQIGTVPLPASAPMFGVGLLALGAASYAVKRKKVAPV